MTARFARRALGTLLAFQAVALSGAPTPAPQIDERAVKEAIAVIEEWARATDRDQWMQTNKSRITPQVASIADQLGAQETRRNQLGNAAMALDFAARAHLLLGERVPALHTASNRLQVDFLRATTAPEYAAIRRTSLDFAQRAESIGEPDLRLAFITLGADCAYFQSQADGKTNDALLLTTLQDLILATSLARSAGSRFVVERLVSLTGGAVEDASSKFHSGQEKFDAALKQVAANTEQAIPVDFSFTIPEIGDEQKTVVAAQVLADLSYQYGSPGVASARLAVAEQRANALNDPNLVVRLLNLRYRGESRAGASPEALRRLRETAWSRAQEIRSGYHSRAGRIWAAYISDELYGVMLKGLITQGSSSQLAETFLAAESLKARALLDRVTLTGTTELDTERTRALERTILGFNPPEKNDDLLMGEMRLVSQLSGFLTLGGDERNRRAALRDLESLYGASTSAGFGNTAAPKSLTAVQADLQPGEALLEYVIPAGALHPASDLFILLTTRAQVWSAHVPLDKVLGLAPGLTGRIAVDGRAPIDSSALSDLIAETRVAIRSSDEAAAKRRLKVLHEILVQPLLDQGVKLDAFTRVVIVPHGPLHYVPFPALIDRANAYLISKAPITIAPSASVWSVLQARTSTADRLLVLANPELEGRQLRNLAFAEQEAAAVAKSAPVAARDVFIGPKALKSQFLTSAQGASLLHISTHGEFPDDSALDLHALWLGAPDRHGIDLRAAEVRRTNLSAARLVVLSVCNGGLYRIGPSDEPYGLMPAFLEAGAQNVMGTLWSLDDQFGRDFMVEFYQHLREGPAKAYQLTAQHFIAADEYIRRWAGFVMVGPGRPFQ